MRSVFHGTLSELVSRNTELVERLPKLAYQHDIAVISARGAVLSKMASQRRGHEEIPVLEARSRLGVPTLYEPNEGDVFEGCLLLDPNTIFIANTERHNSSSIQRKEWMKNRCPAGRRRQLAMSDHAAVEGVNI